MSPFIDALWLHRCTKKYELEHELDDDALDEERFRDVVLTKEYPDTACVAELLGAYIPLVTTCPHGSHLEIWLVWRGWKGLEEDLALWN